MATPEEMAAKMIANLPEKTGKPLGDWLKVVAASGLDKHGKIVAMLKSEHGVGHGFANLIASEALKSDGPVDLVSEQYSGAKADLKPIHDAIVAFTLSLDDLVIASFTAGPSSTTLPIKIFSSVRLGVSPEINALSTIIIAIVTIGVISASLISKRQIVQRQREEAQAG